MQGVRSGPYWFWQLFKKAHGLVCAHTAAPSQGGCADKWVKGAEVFCVRTLYEGHFPPVFLQQRTEMPRETFVNLFGFCHRALCSGVQPASYQCGGWRSPASPHSFGIYDVQKELFKETESIKIPRSPFRPRYIGISIWLKWRCQLQCHDSTRVYKVPVIGSQGHMARF